MSSETQSVVTIDGDRVIVQEAEIADPEVANYLSEVGPEQRDDAFERALRVGVVTLGLASTTEKEEFVERRFEELRRDFEDEIDRIENQIEETFGDDGEVPQTLETHLGEDGSLRTHIEHAFGEDGIFAERLDEELGEDGERIQDALNPDREDTPTYRLKTTLQDQIERLRDKIEEESATEELKQRTTLKGDDFEDNVGQILDNLVYGTSHEVEPTGEVIGELTDRKVGDYVLTLAETGQRIVIEAKSDQSYTQPKIKAELDDAIENRDADYGIIVFEAESQVPNKVGYFHEFDTDRLSIALSDDEDDIEPGYLRIGFNWARTRLIQTSVDSDTNLDPEAIQSGIEGVESEIESFSTIRSKTTKIRDRANEIDAELDEMQSEIKSQLTDIRTEIRSADS